LGIAGVKKGPALDIHWRIEGRKMREVRLCGGVPTFTCTEPCGISTNL
jgi:hypothetical protein